MELIRGSTDRNQGSSPKGENLVSRLFIYIFFNGSIPKISRDFCIIVLQHRNNANHAFAVSIFSQFTTVNLLYAKNTRLTNVNKYPKRG